MNKNFYNNIFVNKMVVKSSILDLQELYWSG